MTLPVVIAVPVPGSVLVCSLIGHHEEKSGFWQTENNLRYRFTPCPEEMHSEIRASRKMPEKGSWPGAGMRSGNPLFCSSRVFRAGSYRTSARE